MAEEIRETVGRAPRFGLGDWTDSGVNPKIGNMG